MQIRKTKREDLKKIVKIFRIEKAKKPYSQKLTNLEASGKIKNFFEKDDMYTLEINKTVIGFCVCEKKNREKIYLSELWIDKKHQNKRFGKEIMNFIEDKYKKNGYKEISLVADKNANASKFYEKIGYKVKNEWLNMVKKLK